MRIQIRHETLYRYPEPAFLGPQLIRLRPAAHTRANVLRYDLTVSPDCKVQWQLDPWANRIARLTFEKDQGVKELKLVVEAAFAIRPVNPFDFFLDEDSKKIPFKYSDGLKMELSPFLSKPKIGPKLIKLLESVPFSGSTIDYIVKLNSAVANAVGYVIRTEPGIQSSEETLTKKLGSCRDSAMVLVDALRSKGLAARFVSGYLVQLTDEGNIPDKAKGVSEDVVDLHAWAEVYLPGAGWIGLDGTSGLLCGEGHIPLAGTVSPQMAAPIDGLTSVGATEFDFNMAVERLGHEPRPRKPYEEEEWQRILKSGEAIDASLKKAGLELTSGGEPTWTSRLHPTKAEWNTEALGDTKLEQGLAMSKHLADNNHSPGTLTMLCMGKHYPGEPLPRWALHLIWRSDGVPVWRDPRLLETQNSSSSDKKSKDAKALCQDLAKRLGIENALVPGYEDPWHFIKEEQNLPSDVDPLAANLDDSDERRRLARALGHGLGNPVGFALPLGRDEDKWTTCEWEFRRGHMFLLPGESAMGLRMPLDRLRGEPAEFFELDPTTLEDRFSFKPDELKNRTRTALIKPTGSVRTAICFEEREGCLYVYLPPLKRAEWFLELVAVLEDSAAALGLKVSLEGYPPSSDPRLEHCLVTPDPGVIEVNLPVCHSLRQYTEEMERLAEAALHAGLTTEKFQLDGREAGSGGGNHLALGGPTALSSPWLTRPDLLGGSLRYIQNHPAFSFLFTGMFVGPTSQAPRIDEGRHDALGELELALSQIPRPGEGEPPAPWLIDRLLRNLLVDVSGNTHRTEVCIDKLYDPISAAGRQGLVEFRAFEMPPHPRMATVQMLLVRALVCRLEKEHYEAPLVRWGTQIHDKFMLPHFLWADMRDIVEDFKRVGVPLELSWFKPFLDQRCPIAGIRQIDDVSIEIRSALEPWPALGEESVGASVARYVDASLERLQVKVSGLTEGRHAIMVNGVVVPLAATNKVGEAVGGVRFRAWQPPYCLQPQIGLHHPLQFDLIDTWSKRSLGACTYHVWHPEGRGYDEPPLTLFEALARRAQRFTTEGHTQSPIVVQKSEPHPDHPYTLDLRLHSKGQKY